jgi:hypothetical protein
MGDSTVQYPLTGRWVRSRKFTFADKNSTKAVLDVPANTFIPSLGVVLLITTLFAGGTPTIDVGDGTNTDGWIDNTDVTVGTVGAYAGTETNTAAFSGTGKLYTAADTIDVILPNEAITAGAAYAMAYMIDVSDVIDD